MEITTQYTAGNLTVKQLKAVLDQLPDETTICILGTNSEDDTLFAEMAYLRKTADGKPVLLITGEDYPAELDQV